MVTAQPMRKTRPLLVLAAAALLAACGSRSPAPAEVASGDLEGPLVEQRWNLLLVGTSERLSMPETPWFEIGRDGRLVGSDGCNEMRGRMRLGDSQRIEVTELATTRRGCPQLEDAARVTTMLETAYRYLIDHDRLVFFGPDQRVLGGWREAN
ncbi:META domain-containing protein [Halomonas sp. SSL-5]|uniref:META domain-containing protein n=1 Tax=Halomonas sp. SSL-5 TaxID=3065855 RepID=UPI0027398D1F|nr:META domain-containing protein [Halomonas sp. SSL-5]MDY7114815.1 META domain-containing protein [Halomonas sp. SSL-5]